MFSCPRKFLFFLVCQCHRFSMFLNCVGPVFLGCWPLHATKKPPFHLLLEQSISAFTSIFTIFDLPSPYQRTCILKITLKSIHIITFKKKENLGKFCQQSPILYSLFILVLLSSIKFLLGSLFGFSFGFYIPAPYSGF